MVKKSRIDTIIELAANVIYLFRRLPMTGMDTVAPKYPQIVTKPLTSEQVAALEKAVEVAIVRLAASPHSKVCAKILKSGLIAREGE